jgi:hypothetical protein
MTEIQVAFDGSCAFATSLGREGIGDPKTAFVQNGTTYYFQNGVAKLLFRLLPGTTDKAHAAWNSKP